MDRRPASWSPDGLAVFVAVLDASVQTVNAVDPNQAKDKCYQGDSIELFISSGDKVTGQTGVDTNTLHVIIPADGPAVSVKTSNVNGASTGTPTELPTSQYKQVKTPTGYAVEAQLPWPGGAPNVGTQVRFDIGLNSADSNFGGFDDMRDGQLLYSSSTMWDRWQTRLARAAAMDWSPTVTTGPGARPCCCSVVDAAPPWIRCGGRETPHHPRTPGRD